MLIDSARIVAALVAASENKTKKNTTQHFFAKRAHIRPRSRIDTFCISAWGWIFNFDYWTGLGVSGIDPLCKKACVSAIAQLVP